MNAIGSYMFGGKMKVFIAVPTTPFGGIHPECFKSIYGLDRAGCWVVFDYMSGYDCAQARNRIAKQAQSEHADFVLMVDSDTVLPPDTLKLMMEEPSDVLAACCPHRPWSNIYDGRVNATKLGESDYTDFYTASDLAALRGRGVTRELVHGCGFGATMVRTEVFGRLEWPWFKWVDYPDGNCLSEDLSFCERCHEAGIPVHIDPRILCGHVFRRVEYPEVM